MAPLVSSWIAFGDVVDEGVLLSVFEYLSPHGFLQFLETASSVVARLDGPPCFNVIRSIAVARLGEPVARAAAEKARCFTDMEDIENTYRERRGGGFVSAMRALASRTPLAEAFRLALKAVHWESRVLQFDAGSFLDALYRAEVWQRCPLKPDNCNIEAAAAAADAGISAVILRGDAGSRRLLLSSVKAMHKAEEELGGLYELRHNSKVRSVYEDVARRRSAVEFLRDRLPETANLADLDAATEELDKTIRGCVEEGFELACRFPRHGVPYAHWWLFLGVSS